MQVRLKSLGVEFEIMKNTRVESKIMKNTYQKAQLTSKYVRNARNDYFCIIIRKIRKYLLLMSIVYQVSSTGLQPNQRTWYLIPIGNIR